MKRNRAAPVYLIKQHDLGDLRDLQLDVKEQRKKLAELESQLDADERQLVALFDAGGNVEPGPLLLGIYESGRRNVAWREAFEARLGEDAALAVLNGTPPTISRTPIITERKR